MVNKPGVSSERTSITAWKNTKVMNMHDLSRDDDFLSHLLVEKLGTATIPLLVHKMDPSRFVPKVKVEELMTIVRRMIQTKGPPQNVIREAVTQLLYISAVRWYTKSFTQKQLNAFATHASRYFELYLPTGSIEIAHTQRYTHRTGKSELCILATRPLAPGTVITELKGSMADLTEQEDQELKSTDRRQPSGGIRRDFSVIHSKQLKKNHLFLGPARFVNHDCDNNCELFREGRYITFRVIRPIAIGEEVTAHYGDAYFGRGNRHCLCETCERNGVGGYGPQAADDLSDGGSSDVEPEGDEAQPEVNVNERRTRRGVYAVLKESDDEDADEEEEEPAMELQGEVETGFLSAPAASSRASSAAAKNFLTPDPEPSLSSAAGTPSMEDGRRRTRPAPAPVELVISTRGQKARAASLAAQVQSLPTPPLSDDAASLTERTSRPPRATRARLAALRGSEDMATRPSTPMDKGKAKAQASAEPEPRVLRGRQLAAASASAPPGPAPGSKLKAKEKQKEKEKQKLPTCETCLKVLPIISLDQKVIWGDFDNASGKGKGKKKEKRECPRCLRHFAIYSHSWPNRTAAQAAAFIPTPRENTPAESASRAAPQKFLPVLDKKLSMAASSSTLKRPRERSTTIEDSAPKRRKLPPPPTKPSQQRRPPDRPRGQSPVASSSRPAAATSFTPVSLPTKRKRGRPPLRQFPSRAPLAIVRVPAPSTAASQSPSRTPKSRAVDDQPRDSNGRFGKKGSSVAPTSASAPFATSDPPEVLPSTPEAEPTDFRASAMPSLNDDDLELSYPDYPEDEDEDEDDTAPESKRRRVHPDYDLGLEYLSAFEKVRDEEEEDEEDEDDEEDDDDDENDSEPVTFAGGLSFHPNPGSFARRKWAPPLPAPESPLRRERSLPANSELEETEDHVDTYDSVVSAPVRPHRVEDDDLEYLSDVGETLQGQDQSQQDADAETVEEEDDEEEVQEVEAPIISRPRTFSSGGALWKPSPINFATRRWSEKAGQADRQALVGLDVRPPVSSGRAKYGLKLLDMWEAQGKSGRNVTQSSKTPTFHGMTQSTAAEHWDLFDLGSSSSGEEDVVLPDSPEPSKFALRSRVTFSPRPLSLSSLSKPSVVVKSVEQDAAANDQVEVTQADTPSDTQGDTSRAEVEEALLLDDRSTQVTIVGSSVQGSVNVTADEPSEVATLDSDDSSVYDYQIIHGPVEPGDDAVDKVTTDDVPENRKNDNGPVGNDPINLLTMNAAAEKLVEGVGTILDNLLKATNLFSLPGPRPFSSSTPYKLPLARKVTARPAPRSRASTGSSLPKPRKPYAHPTSPLAVPHHASSARLVDGSWDSDA